MTAVDKNGKEMYTEYGYDSVGNQVLVKTGNGTRDIKYEYDSLNRLTKIIYPTGKEEKYGYDLEGNLSYKVDRNGIKTEYSYNALKQLMEEKAVKDGKTYTRTMQYGSTGAKTGESNENINISYKYNNQGLVSEQSYVLNGTSQNIQYDYDSRGNCIKVFYDVDGKHKDGRYWNSCEAWKYSYDAKNRLISVYNDAHLSGEIANYSYDLNGNVLRKTYGNELESEYKYNAANQVVSISNSQYGSFLSDFEYSYNVDGNLTSVSSNYSSVKYIDQKKDNDEDENIKSIKTNYTYDGFGRLIAEDYHKQKEDNSVNKDVKKTYEYDVFGNRTKMNVNEKDNITFGSNVYSTDYTYDDENKLLKEKMSTGEVSKYEYDNNGNQTKKVDGVEGIARVNTLTLGIYGPTESKFKTERRTYDAFNQLTEVSTNGVSARYSYRPDGLRLTKDIDGKHTDFVWNGSQILAEIDDGLEENLRSYSYGLERIKCNHSRETEFYYAYNAHGDVVQLVGDTGFENHDPDTDNFIFKNLLKDYEYDAFGVEVDRDKDDVNSFRYCGEYFDEETESIYLRARYYNPANGRFTTEDPARDGENWYAYCAGNPVGFVDTNGLKVSFVDAVDEDSPQFIAVQKLTDDELGLDENDNVVIVKRCPHPKHKEPTELTRLMIEGDISVDIQLADYGTGSSVSFGFENGKVVVANLFYDTHDTEIEVGVIGADGTYHRETLQDFIIMGHEFCHIYNGMMGDTYELQKHRNLDKDVQKGKNLYRYEYQGVYDEGIREDSESAIAEFRATGIPYILLKRGTKPVVCNFGGYTENVIRKSYGYKARVYYNR